MTVVTVTASPHILVVYIRSVVHVVVAPSSSMGTVASSTAVPRYPPRRRRRGRPRRTERRSVPSSSLTPAGPVTLRVTCVVKQASHPVSLWLQVYTDRQGALEPFPFVDVAVGDRRVLERTYDGNDHDHVGRVLFCELAARRDAGARDATDPVAAITATPLLPSWTLDRVVVDEIQPHGDGATTHFHHPVPLVPGSAVGYSVVLAPSLREERCGHIIYEGTEPPDDDGSDGSDDDHDHHGTANGTKDRRSPPPPTPTTNGRFRPVSRSASPVLTRRRRDVPASSSLRPPPPPPPPVDVVIEEGVYSWTWQ